MSANIETYMHDLGRRARAAARVLARTDTASKNRALLAIAAAIRRDATLLMQQNALDLAQARAAGKDAAFIDRLTLDAAAIEAMAEGVEQVAALPDRKSTRLNSSHVALSRMPSSA